MIGSDKVGFWGTDGKYTGRWITEGAFNRMAERMARGVQSGGTAIGTGYAPQAAKGDAIWGKLKTAGAGAGTAATLRTLKGEGLSLMERVKSFGVLRGIGDLALAATSFEVGYKVGGLVADVLGLEDGHEEVPPSGTNIWYPNSGNAHSVRSPGDALAEGGTAVAPVAEVQILFRQVKSTATLWNLRGPYTGPPNAQCESTTPKIVDEPIGHQRVVAPPIACGGTFPNLVYGASFVEVVPLQVTHLPGEAGANEPKSPGYTKEGSPQTPKNATSATEEMKKCLEGLLGCAAFPPWWWNHDPEVKEETHIEDPRIGLDPADPTAVQIPTPKPGERYKAYDERLEALKLKPTPVVLAETAIDPAVGPEGVSNTRPHVGSNVEPESSVEVRYNPATAPAGSTETEPGIEGGSTPWSPPSIPSIDMSPLSGLSPCGVFPFGLLCWVGEAVGQFNVAGKCPNAAVPIKGFGKEVTFGLSICGSAAEEIMGYVRPLLLLVFTIGCGFMFARATSAVGTDG